MPVPDRWLQYSNFGQRIPGTQFLAIKCPLKKSICDNLPPQLRFTPEMLLAEQPTVAMVIDLTNTTKYYNPLELSGVRHVKVMCPGQQVPNAAVQARFFEAVDSFLQQEDSQERLIGVHCTHGLNRTGFLVCKYMISKLGFSPVEAAKAFNDCRGHKMERAPYLRALKVPREELDSLLGEESNTKDKKYPKPDFRRGRPPPRAEIPQLKRMSRDNPRDSYAREERDRYGQRISSLSRRGAPPPDRSGRGAPPPDRRRPQMTRDPPNEYRRFNPMNPDVYYDWRSDAAGSSSSSRPSNSRYSKDNRR